jgi:hypothetical protein
MHTSLYLAVMLLNFLYLLLLQEGGKPGGGGSTSAGGGKAPSGKLESKGSAKERAGPASVGGAAAGTSRLHFVYSLLGATVEPLGTQTTLEDLGKHHLH